MGLGAAIAKMSGGVVAAHGQARVAARVGAMLRLEVLDDWFAGYPLRRPRQPDHGQPNTRPVPTPPDGPAESAASATHDAATDHDIAVVARAAHAERPLRAAARGVSALTVRVGEVETGLAQGLLGGGRAVAQIVPLVAALIWISPKLAAAAIAVLLPFSLVLSSSRRAWKRGHADAARDNEELLEAADEAIRHADLWVSYSAEPKARATLVELGDRLGRRVARMHAIAAAMSGGNEVLGALALVGALGAAKAGWLGDVGDGGRLLAFTICFFLAYRPIRDLTEARLAWSRAELAFAELSGAGVDLGRVAEEARAWEPTRTPAVDAGAVTPWPLEELRTHGLLLRHGSRAPLSFRLAPGQVLVVAGATGEGKTTLVRTLLGLETALGGSVHYGDRALTDAPPGLVHRPFAWVPQDSALLIDTLEANVSLGTGHETVDVRATLRAFGAEALLQGAGSRRLGPGGVVVSGGERQWIALARALATQQPVLVLDEPTSGLDAESQRQVIEAVDRLRGKRSVIFVTHRTEPLRIADAVLRLERGEVQVEPGGRRTD
jgi:ABC-type bacteriocin/lantibiotic exporter with double-glycine peptidase domain